MQRIPSPQQLGTKLAATVRRELYALNPQKSLACLTSVLGHWRLHFKKGIFLREPIVPYFVLHGLGHAFSDVSVCSCRAESVLASRTCLSFTVLHYLLGCPHRHAPFM
jgi:hypothetical protein